MREFHVVFMYYAYPFLSIFSKVLKDLRDREPWDDYGTPTKLLEAVYLLLHALHLTKGFSSNVSEQIYNPTYRVPAAFYI